MLSHERAGLLAIRGRPIDLVTMYGLGVALTTVAVARSTRPVASGADQTPSSDPRPATEQGPVSTSMTSAPRSRKVTVVGAGFYGSTTAQRLAEYDIFDTVVLTDIVEGKPEGLALDMNQSRPIEGFETKVVGATTDPATGAGYEKTAGSDIVVITAGLPRKPGMSRMDLIETNAKIVRGVAENVAKHSPNAVIIVVSNPLDEMTALAQLASGFPKERVIGQAGMLDTARFSYFVAETLAVPVASVRTLTLGSHGDTMVPVPSRCTVDGKPLADLLPGRQDRRARRPHPQRRCRGRRPAQDRVGLLRPVGRRRAHGQGGGRGLRRRHAGLRLGRRRVRHLRRLPRCRGRDRCRRASAGSSRTTSPTRARRAARGRRGGPRQAGRRQGPLSDERRSRSTNRSSSSTATR